MAAACGLNRRKPAELRPVRFGLTTPSDAFIRVRANLAFLSPRIQEAILAGTQPPDLSLERIVRSGIPFDWDQQERKFRFR